MRELLSEFLLIVIVVVLFTAFVIGKDKAGTIENNLSKLGKTTTDTISDLVD